MLSYAKCTLSVRWYEITMMFRPRTYQKSRYKSLVLILVYNWEIWHHSLVCCCGLADILYILNEENASAREYYEQRQDVAVTFVSLPIASCLSPVG